MTIDFEFTVKLTRNILREFSNPSCRKKSGISNGLAINDVPDWQRRELEDIQATREASRINRVPKSDKYEGDENESDDQRPMSQVRDQVRVVRPKYPSQTSVLSFLPDPA